jgi:hypothetical protein
MTGRDPVDEPASPKVIVHDPGAERPHDLDDPFFDPKVQSRMAGVITDNATMKNEVALSVTKDTDLSLAQETAVRLK